MLEQIDDYLVKHFTIDCQTGSQKGVPFSHIDSESSSLNIGSTY